MQQYNKNISLSVILPAYDDEFTIREVVSSVIKYIKPEVNRLEIIIVEDGSPGKTSEICDQLKIRYPELRVIHHKKNMGYGVTLRDGFNAATQEIISYTDGDNQYDIRDLLTAFDILRETGADAIIGFRDPRRDGLIRFFISKIYNLLFRIFFGIKVKDVNCSFKIIKRDAFKNLALSSKSAFIDAEIIYELNRAGFKIREMSVKNFLNKFRRSHFRNPKLILGMLDEMYKKRFSS